MGKRPRSKLMSTTEAVADYVQDGDSIWLGFGSSPVPHALGNEVIRQRKTGLDIVGGTPGLPLQQFMFHTGVATRSRTSVLAGVRDGRNPGRTWDLANEGAFHFEDYTNQTVAMMLMAGALGIPFIPTRSMLGTDFLKDENINHPRGFLKDKKLKVMDDPFTGQPVVLLPAIRPGVAIWHVQRADAQGNAQAWGVIADAKWALWASERVIISAEEIVPTEVIRSDPNRTIIPGAKVSAVVHEPYGGFPGELTGYYMQDPLFGRVPQAGYDAYLDEWVYSLSSHQEYIAHYVEKFGFAHFQGFLPKRKAQPIGTVDYAFRPNPGW